MRSDSTAAASTRATAFYYLVIGVIVLILAQGAIGAGTASADSARSAVQQNLDQLVADGVPGAIALVRRGQTEQRYAAGVADLRTGRPITPDDRFRIGSMTKAFIATVLLQKVGEGQLSLDDTVAHWLPGLVPDGADVTVRELMNHTSGIPDYINMPFYLHLLHDPLQFYTPLELVHRAVAQPALFPPGTRFSYSNTDYIVLGLILAKLDHTYSATALQIATPAVETYARIFGPLGLRDTSFPLFDPNISGPHTDGYVIDPPADWDLPPVLDTTQESPSWAWTAGAIVSTLADVATFHRALFDGRLLAPAQEAELETTVPVAPGLDYGLGVFRIATPCGDAWGHDGGTPSSVSISLTSVDGSHQTVLMANRDANTWTAQIFTDYNEVLISAFCGGSATAASARQMAETLVPFLKVSQ